MKKKLGRLIAAAIIAVGVAAVVWRMSAQELLPVTTATVGRGIVEDTVANTRAGTVKACRRAGLSPTIGGQIAELPVREGDAVDAGQILLELWNDDLSAQVTHAERDVGAVSARADEACVSADVAEREANRLTRLLERSLASEEDADRAVGQAAATRAACRAATTSISVSEAQLDVAKAALERTILRAPFAGTIAEINGELGEFVTPSPVGIPTPPAVDLVDNSCLYISAPIDEVDAPAIRAGMTARVTMDAFPDRSFPGVVRRVAPYVLDLEQQARTVDVEAVIENADGLEQLLPGYSADVEVIVAASDGVLRIPTQAVLEGGRVFVFDSAAGVASETAIETGLSNWDHTEVLSGLEEGQVIVLSVDRPGLADGVQVVAEDR